MADNGKYKVFANAKAIEKCPVVNKDGETSGSVFVAYVSFNGDEYVLFVKDRTKNYITNPSGSRNIGEEFLDCAVRECEEETSLVFDKHSVREIGSFDHSAWSFDVQWPGKSKVFCSGLKNISQEEFERLTAFECDEIEKVLFIPVEKDGIKWSVVKGKFYFSTHHKICAEFAVSGGMRGTDWSGLKYLKNFKLQ